LLALNLINLNKPHKKALKLTTKILLQMNTKIPWCEFHGSKNEDIGSFIAEKIWMTIKLFYNKTKII
jgi:hypothetical protein